MLDEYFKKTHDAIQAIVIGGAGGGAYYLYQIKNGERFRIAIFLINITLAGYIGYLMGEVLPIDAEYRDALISISGFLSLEIIKVIENKGLNFLIKKIK